MDGSIPDLLGSLPEDEEPLPQLTVKALSAVTNSLFNPSPDPPRPYPDGSEAGSHFFSMSGGGAHSASHGHAEGQGGASAGPSAPLESVGGSLMRRATGEGRPQAGGTPAPGERRRGCEQGVKSAAVHRGRGHMPAACASPARAHASGFWAGSGVVKAPPTGG
eukprot:scaffold10361_cov79-Isochrysis_galbana.AAC.1